MGVKYTNRKGDVYYLQAKQTKTGKTAYSFARKLTGKPVATLPEGFEIFEDPAQGQVFLRKARPSSITPAERELLENCLRELTAVPSFRVAVDGESLIVYISDLDPEKTLSALDGFAPLLGSDREKIRDQLVTRATYSRMLRFTVVEGPERLFYVERWCYRGSIDDWIELDGLAPLEQLARKYVKHLGKMSFYDLI